MRRLSLLVFSVLAACAARNEPEPALMPAPETTRAIAQGTLTGFRSPEGVNVWLGVPFAAPPVGDLRWRAPRPAQPWDGVLNALSHGPRCAQMTNRYDRPEGLTPGNPIGSEDCLTLNVYAPDKADNLPVMFWIHGGGNVWGHASSYHPQNLAANENVLVVTVQYRVGPFGWFAHEALRDSAEVPLDRSANFGIMDQIAALEWVRDNIAIFGGDASRVTIFGESAGGYNVASLLAAPAAKGLFHRAILQSGSFDSFPADEAENGSEKTVNSASEIAARLGAKTAADLHALAMEDILQAYNSSEFGFLNLPTIIADDPLIPTPTLREAFDDPATFNAVPIMTGTNRDEMKLFQALDPRLVHNYFNLFIWPKRNGFYNALSDYQSRLWRLRSVDGPAERMAAGGHVEVYGYRFDWDDAGRLLLTDLKNLMGAAHSMEIPFVFNRFEFFGDVDRVVFQKKTAADREALSRAMGSYWADFARTGDPNGDGRPSWPVYTSGNRAQLLRFDTQNDGGIAILEGVETADLILADLKEDKRINDKERCIIAGALIDWAPSFEDRVRAVLPCR